MSESKNIAPESTESQEALNEIELEEISGGLNPQPLPPIVQDHI